jgi:hypothetical protein
MRRAFWAVFVWAALSCGTPADQAGIGAQCTQTSECINTDLTCLTQFKGGYCGASGCQKHADCPEGSICVTHEGANYCFRTCTDKIECNRNRSLENESNCSSSITPAESSSSKACVPPSGS